MSQRRKVLLGRPASTKKCQDVILNLNEVQIVPVKTVKNLGIIFDQNMSMTDQISSLCKNLYFELYRISLVRKYLSSDVTKQLIVSLVLSKMDYCNILLSGLPNEHLKKLQCIQNYAAKIVLRKKKSDHVTPLLYSLHWLPVRERIEYKTATIVFKCLNDLAPSYLSELIHENYKPRSLRSSNDTSLLFIPKKNLKSYGDRSFEYCGPKVWNALPRSLREKDSLMSFKCALKKFLFIKAYSDLV